MSGHSMKHPGLIHVDAGVWELGQALGRDQCIVKGEAVTIRGAGWKRSSGGSEGVCEPLADPTVCSACSPPAAPTTPCSPSWAASTAGPWVSCPLSDPQLPVLVLRHTVPVQKIEVH